MYFLERHPGDSNTGIGSVLGIASSHPRKTVAGIDNHVGTRGDGFIVFAMVLFALMFVVARASVSKMHRRPLFHNVTPQGTSHR